MTTVEFRDAEEQAGEGDDGENTGGCIGVVVNRLYWYGLFPCYPFTKCHMVGIPSMPPSEKKFGLDLPTKELLARMQEQFARISAMKIDEVIRKDLPGQDVITEITDLISELINVCSILSQINLASVPQNIRSNFVSFFNAISGFINARKTLNDQNIAQLASQTAATREQAINIYTSQYFCDIIGLLPYLMSKSEFRDNYLSNIKVMSETALAAVESSKQQITKNIDEEIKKFRKSSSAITDIVTSAQGDMESKVKSVSSLEERVNSLITKIETKTATSQLAKHSAIFSQISDAHKRSGNRWLLASIVGTMVLVGLGGWFIFPYIYLNTSEEINKYAESNSAHMAAVSGVLWQIAIAKISLIAILAGSVAWMARNHRRNRHNEIVANHRKATLSSFEQLHAALGSTDSAREGILLKSIEAIFLPIPTGYADEDKAEFGGSQILEIIKSGK